MRLPLKTFNGKLKAITFSYDDGVTQDKRLVGIFNKYGLKATFNVNSELLGNPGSLVRDGQTISHCKIEKSEVADVYRGHEVAAHTLTHPNLTTQEEKEIIRQVEEDRKNLEQLAGYPIVGMAYPCGGVNNNDFVADVLRRHTAIKYSRTITSTHDFEPQTNLLRFNPTVYHHGEWDKMFELAERFLSLTPDRPQLFYIWGHSYEFDIFNQWDGFEDFCRMVGGRDDIFYGTNREVLL